MSDIAREALERIMEGRGFYDPHDYWGNGGEMECRYCWESKCDEHCPYEIARAALAEILREEER